MESPQTQKQISELRTKDRSLDVLQVEGLAAQVLRSFSVTPVGANRASLDNLDSRAKGTIPPYPAAGYSVLYNPW